VSNTIQQIQSQEPGKPERKYGTRKLKPKSITRYPAPNVRKRDVVKTTTKTKYRLESSSEFNNCCGRNRET
jgi:hypothetical protein